MTPNDVLAATIMIYLAPAAIAFGRNHRAAPAILALTLFLGWTGLGWIVALVWSLTGDVRGAPGAGVAVTVNASPVVNVALPEAAGAQAEMAVRLAMLEGALEAHRLDALARAAFADARLGRLVEDLRREG